MSFPSIAYTIPDGVARTKTRLLSQFADSKTLQSLLEALSKEVQALIEATAAVLVDRTIMGAFGVQLDALGRIVGQKRINWDTTSLPWFAPDATLTRPDTKGLVYVSGGSTGSAQIVTDSVYKQLIESKIYRNFCKYGSVTEIQTAVKALFGIDIGFIRQDIMHVVLVVPEGTDSDIVTFIKYFYNDTRSERIGTFPYPATLSIDPTVIYQPVG